MDGPQESGRRIAAGRVVATATLAGLLPFAAGRLGELARKVLWRLGVVGIDIAVLAREVPEEHRHRGFEAHILRRPSPEITRVGAALGHGVGPDRAERRFAHGLSFLALYEGGVPVASTWAVSGGTRYIDELGLGYETGPDGVWLRDVFVAPDHRGRHLFARLLDALADGDPRPRRFLSDVARINTASLRAHEHYGFEAIGRLMALHVRGGLMVREERLCPLAPSLQFAPGRALFRTGAAFREFTRPLRA